MTDIDTGLNVWQMTSNHNRMIELQADTSPDTDGPVDIAYFGGSGHSAVRQERIAGYERAMEERGLGPTSALDPGRHQRPRHQGREAPRRALSH